LADALDVARQEIARYQRLTDRRLLVAIVVLGALVGGIWPVAQDRGVHPDQGLYAIQTEEGSPVAAVVDSDPSLVHAGEGRAPDVIVSGNRIVWSPDSDRSEAAADRLETAAQAYMDEVSYNETGNAVTLIKRRGIEPA